MKTDVINVSSRGNQIVQALDLVDRVAAYKRLSSKEVMPLRLLTEEMMGMMRSITGETEGQFWIEDQDSDYRLHLKAFTRMDSGKREQLLSASSSGKNESAHGLMGRLRDLLDRGADADIAAVSNPLMMSGMCGEQNTPMLDVEWSLGRYIDEYQHCPSVTDAQREVWDELEKSVVTHVADDVKVSIKGQNVEMIICKKL